jgi:hypothetical protein
MGGQQYKIEWQIEKFDISEEEAKEKIKKIKEKEKAKQAYPFSIKWQIEKFGISEEEAKEKIEKIKNKIKEKQKNKSEWEHKAISPKNKEHWLKKGYSLEDSIELAKNQIKHMQLCFIKKRSENPEKYKNTYITKKEYWIKKGLSEEEAKEKISENQKTFSLKKCISKFGEKEGKRKWAERQTKWQKTLNNKSEIEKIKINKSKGQGLENLIIKYGEKEGIKKYYEINIKRGITLENQIKKWGKEEGIKKYNKWYENRIKTLLNSPFYSRISQELFYKLLNQIEDKKSVKFASHNGEKRLRIDGKSYIYDFCYKNKIIEFNGDFWHANPSIYESSNEINNFLKLSVEQIWEKDKIKNNFAKNKGYDVLVIWERDYKNNPEKEIEKCLNFIKT